MQSNHEEQKSGDITFSTKISFIIWGLILTPIFAFVLSISDLPNSLRELHPQVVSSPSPGSVYFSEAVRHATEAAGLAQTAKTSSQWAYVADRWRIASENMTNVPSIAPNYALAQEKAQEYQQNHSSIIERLNQSNQVRAIAGKAVFERAKQEYPGIELQVRGQLTSVPELALLFPKNVWEEISDTDKVNLTLYAETQIPSFRNEGSYLCDDCWSIMAVIPNGKDLLLERYLVKGDTPWQASEPEIRGQMGSVFRQEKGY